MTDQYYFKLLQKLLSFFTAKNLEYLVYNIKPQTYFEQVEARVNFDVRQRKVFPYTTIYEATIDDKVVHHGAHNKFNYLLWQLGLGRCNIIADCETSTAFQGQGIYPAMLNRIIQDVKSQKSPPSSIYIIVKPHNIPSIKGIERAGFHFLFHVSVKRIGPFLVNRNYSLAKITPSPVEGKWR